MVNGPDTVYVERTGKLDDGRGDPFIDEDHLRRIIDKIVSADRSAHRRVDPDGATPACPTAPASTP